MSQLFSQGKKILLYKIFSQVTQKINEKEKKKKCDIPEVLYPLLKGIWVNF